MEQYLLEKILEGTPLSQHKHKELTKELLAELSVDYGEYLI